MSRNSHDTYKGIEVYKLNTWVQGRSCFRCSICWKTCLKAMGYNSVDYIHTLYQVMNLAFATGFLLWWSFFPLKNRQGLLSKDYAGKGLNWLTVSPMIRRANPVSLSFWRQAKSVPTLSGKMVEQRLSGKTEDEARWRSAWGRGQLYPGAVKPAGSFL
jgi:hypothetical protein